MSAYEMLVKCGYSPAEAERISGQKRPEPPKPTQREIAAANEEKYWDAPMSAEERFMCAHSRFNYERYSDVGNRCVNQGRCTTRKGLVRRLKYGKGSISRDGFMRKGFDENKGGAE